MQAIMMTLFNQIVRVILFKVLQACTHAGYRDLTLFNQILSCFNVFQCLGLRFK